MYQIVLHSTPQNSSDNLFLSSRQSW